MQVLCENFVIFSRPYLSNGRAYGIRLLSSVVVRLSSATDILWDLWLSVRSWGKTFYTTN